jgi:hypothetical protein
MVWERTCTMVERPRFHPTTEVVGFPARIVSRRSFRLASILPLILIHRRFDMGSPLPPPIHREHSSRWGTVEGGYSPPTTFILYAKGKQEVNPRRDLFLWDSDGGAIVLSDLFMNISADDNPLSTLPNPP